MSAAAVSASARPFVMRGIADAMPPVPVLVPTPAPVRLNQSSTVNWAERRPGEAPIVTYWLLPFSWMAWFPAAEAGDEGRITASTAMDIRKASNRARRVVADRVFNVDPFRRGPSGSSLGSSVRAHVEVGREDGCVRAVRSTRVVEMPNDRTYGWFLPGGSRTGWSRPSGAPSSSSSMATAGELVRPIVVLRS